MTGGRQRIELREYPRAVLKPASPPASEDERVVLEALANYERAARFRRKANRKLAALGLSFASWRVLDATVRVVRRKDDACSHQDVSLELGLDEASVGRTMTILSKRGWVSHDLEYLCTRFRVLPTESGTAVLASALAAVAAAAREIASPRAG